jgi:hypothetical protein
MEGFPHVNARLQETPFKRYPACENSYRAFIHTKNEDFLWRLDACFYCVDGLEFSDGRAIENARKFDKMPFHLYSNNLILISEKDEYRPASIPAMQNIFLT